MNLKVFNCMSGSALDKPSFSYMSNKEFSEYIKDFIDENLKSIVEDVLFGSI